MRSQRATGACCVSILAAATIAGFAGSLPILDNPAAALPRPAFDNARWRLEMAGLVGWRSLTILIDCEHGKWVPVSTSVSGDKPPKVDSSLSRMTVAGGRLTGTFVVIVGTNSTTVELEGAAGAFPDAAAWAPTLDHDPFGDGGRWWSVMADSQGVNASLEGTWKSGGRSGTFKGGLTLRQEPGRFDMGAPKGNGLELRFDMGRRRVNWNHARVAVYTFPKPVDLRSFAGLKVTVETAELRKDVELSVWLREEDGSWYYGKSAIPLVTNRIEAFVDLKDFAEAEWVAPGSHVDEDYEFDRSAVTHFGIGLVNPLGVGRVTFTLNSVHADGTPATVPPASVAVSGRLLAVNGVDCVPPALFGGFAWDLPQQYRPGCQRNIRFVPGGAPSVPDVNSASISTNALVDWKALAGRLVSAEAGTPEASVFGIAEETQRKALASAVAREGGKSGPAALAQVLNAALRDRRWTTNLLARADLPAELRTGLADENASGTAKTVAARRLMEHLWAGQIVPFRRSTELFNIDCMGDRFVPALNLTARDWRDQISRLGSNYAATAKAMGYQAVIEWWNEPYLNWARGSEAKNYDPQYYDQTKAEDGGPVTIKATGETFDLLRWRKTDRGWRVYDPSQFGYFSGKANGRLYDDMIAVIGPVLKEAGNVTLVGGWGFRWHEDHWAAWELLYRPTIDRGIAWLDGIVEHHYQGDTTAMSGSYEVLNAYTVTRHKRLMPVYNTECNDLVDAPARGAVDTPEKAKAATNFRRMTYNLRDIIHMVRHVPDKAVSRTVIHNQHTPEGTDAAYGLMADLRGRLVETSESDPDVWCVASVDGTDPRAPREDGQRRLVTILFNDHREPVKVNLRVDPPSGTSLQNGTVEEIAVDRASWAVGRRSSPAKVVANVFVTDVVLPARTAWKVEFPLAGDLPPKAQVRRNQAFSPDILREVTRERPFETAIAVEADRVRDAKRAWLRMVLEDVAPGEGWVDVGGKRTELPTCRTADNCNRIVELPLASVPPAGNLPVRFSVAEGPYAGYRVDMVSVVLEGNGR